MCTYSERWRDETWERSLYRAGRREQRKHARGNGVRRRRRKVRKRGWKRAQQPLGLRFVPTAKICTPVCSREKGTRKNSPFSVFFPFALFLECMWQVPSTLPTCLPTYLPSYLPPCLPLWPHLASTLVPYSA